MADNKLVFNNAGARRIVNAVKKVERTPTDLTRRKHGRYVTDTPQQFWVSLVAESPTIPGAYSWKKVYPENHTLTDASPAITSGSDYTAKEVNARAGLVADTKALVMFVGYDATTAKPWYYFTAGGGGGTDFFNHNTVALRDAEFVRINNDNGSGGILGFLSTATDPDGTGATGTPGVNLALSTPQAGNTHKGIFWNGSQWVIDWARAH